MSKNLFVLFERIAATLPEALNTFRAQTQGGFITTSERLLAVAIDHLEGQGNYLTGCHEDAITSSVVGFFNRYGVRASSQTNSRGHVDILIEHSFQPGLKICGEAKIWRGSKYHLDGMKQVLGYCTGRLPYCFVLEYVTTGTISDKISELRRNLDVKLPENQRSETSDHETIQWALVTFHLHTSGETVKVLHAAANLSK